MHEESKKIQALEERIETLAKLNNEITGIYTKRANENDKLRKEKEQLQREKEALLKAIVIITRDATT